MSTPFNPHFGSGVTLAAGAGALSVTVTKSNKTAMVLNTGNNLAFFRFYDSTGTTTAASITDCPIAGGQRLIVEKSNRFDTFSYISPIGTTLYLITGEGGY